MTEWQMSELTQLSSRIAADRDDHERLLPQLGEYLALRRHRPAEVDALFPSLIIHLASECPTCVEAREAIEEMLDAEDEFVEQVGQILTYEHRFPAYPAEAG